MSLTLEIEHLTGVAYAARGIEGAEPDWPPQPDRVFSALVAAWAARGQRPEERRALTWLEELPAPRIAASEAYDRPAPVSFVPPNDPSTGRKGNANVFPVRRTRAPRRFPAALPHDSTCHLVWPEAEPEPEVLASLNALARDTAYIGHSASLTRCLFRTTAETPHALQGPARRVYKGRLDELVRAYERKVRPSPGHRVAPAPERSAEPARGPFSPRWLVLEFIDRTAEPEDFGPPEHVPDLRAAALLGKALIKAVMSGYGAIGAAIPREVSGHEPDGSPTSAPHLAAVPLAFLGHPHADGRLFGLALVPAAGEPSLLDDPFFQQAVKAVADFDAKWGRRFLTLTVGGLAIDCAIETLSDRDSLRPVLYTGAGRVWATATPMVLDRHLKATSLADRQAEKEALIREACARANLPDPVRVVAHKHAAHPGAPSAEPSGRAPAWTGWRLPEALQSRPLSHAVIRFAEPVAGPILLGAGRFCGLGLFRPLDGTRAP
jgi:CRISPR-associated protein Csb2